MKGEQLRGEAVFTAQCGEKIPYKDFSTRKDIDITVELVESQPQLKHSFCPQKEKWRDFSVPSMNCDSCAPDIKNIASNSDLFYGYIFGNIK